MFTCTKTSRNGERRIIVKDDQPGSRRELHFNAHKALALINAITDGNRMVQRLGEVIKMIAKGVKPRMNEDNPYDLVPQWHHPKRADHGYYALVGPNGLFISQNDAEMITATWEHFINGLWYLAGSGEVVGDTEAERGREVVLPSGEVGISRGRKANGAIVVETDEGLTVDYVPMGTVIRNNRKDKSEPEPINTKPTGGPRRKFSVSVAH